MKRLIALAAALLMFGAYPAATAGPSQGGISSDNVEYVGFIPFEPGTSTGVTIQGKYMYLTSWKNISIYDISNPEAPEQTDMLPVGFMFENENVAVSPGGKFLLFSESLPNDILHVYDVEDKTNIQEIGQVEGAGDHTSDCILKCKWAYGSDGAITNLKDPANPELQYETDKNGDPVLDDEGNPVELDWRKLATGQSFSNHDVTEVKNGFILTAPISGPFHYIDVRNPLKPKLIAQGKKEAEEGWLFHSAVWPRGGKDKHILMQGELNAQTRCDDVTGPFQSYNASKWKKTKTFTMIDTFRVQNGTYADGSPAVNGLGCSAHWFEEHPTYKNNGLVAVGYYEHGTRFLSVDAKGKISEAGYFLPHAGSTSAAYWVSEKKNADLVYAADYVRGLDILRYNGDL